MGMSVVEAYIERGIFGKLKASVLLSVMQNAYVGGRHQSCHGL